jgi:cytoskeletal protein RodZ
MSSIPFGEHLKREREMRGVSLEEIAAATRISTRFLEAIENERWDQLPGGVFNRGFIRSIARYLGMDEDSLVAEYNLGAKSNGHSQAQPLTAIPAQDLPRNWKPAAVAVLVMVVLIGGSTFALVHYRSKISAGVHRGVAAVGAQIHRIRARRHGALETASPPARTASASPSAPATANSSATSAVPLTLKLEAGMPAHVKVVADGKVVFNGPVHVNDVKQFQAHDKFHVTASQSSALLLELNGQTVPPIGTPGQPGSVTLTRSDLNPASGVAH